MNPLTTNFLETIWSGNPTFKDLGSNIDKECKGLCVMEAGVIGKDLILRRMSLYNKSFKLAAYLASDGEAGNDGFADFTDCVALLPEIRYKKIYENHDNLIEDEVSTAFDELYLVAKVSNVFDEKLLGDDERSRGFLDYLVSDNSGLDWDVIESGSEEDAKTLFPRLYKKFGYLFEPRSANITKQYADTASLVDLIPNLDEEFN